MKLKETLTGPTAVAAYVGAVAALIAAYLGYRAGERQYAFDHDKWLLQQIVFMAAKPENKGYVKYVVDAGFLSERDRDAICNAFKPVDSTACPKNSHCAFPAYLPDQIRDITRTLAATWVAAC
jgi:hypothetical protein